MSKPRLHYPRGQGRALYGRNWMLSEDARFQIFKFKQAGWKDSRSWRWGLAPSRQSSIIEADRVLARAGVLGSSFPTRARALDALQLALFEEEKDE